MDDAKRGTTEYRKQSKVDAHVNREDEGCGWVGREREGGALSRGDCAEGVGSGREVTARPPQPLSAREAAGLQRFADKRSARAPVAAHMDRLRVAAHVASEPTEAAQRPGGAHGDARHPVSGIEATQSSVLAEVSVCVCV